MALPHDLIRFPEACEVADVAGVDDRDLISDILGGRLISYVSGGRLYVRRLDLDLWIRRSGQGLLDAPVSAASAA